MNNIILASSSPPRRRELLEKYHVGHKVVESKIIEKKSILRIGQSKLP